MSENKIKTNKKIVLNENWSEQNKIWSNKYKMPVFKVFVWEKSVFSPLFGWIFTNFLDFIFPSNWLNSVHTITIRSNYFRSMKQICWNWKWNPSSHIDIAFHWHQLKKLIYIFFLNFYKNNKKKSSEKKCWAISESFLSYPSVAGDSVSYSKIGLKFLNYWNLCNARNLMRYGVQKPFFCLLVSSNRINSNNWCSTWLKLSYRNRNTSFLASSKITNLIPICIHNLSSLLTQSRTRTRIARCRAFFVGIPAYLYVIAHKFMTTINIATVCVVWIWIGN